MKEKREQIGTTKYTKQPIYDIGKLESDKYDYPKHRMDEVPDKLVHRGFCHSNGL